MLCYSRTCNTGVALYTNIIHGVEMLVQTCIDWIHLTMPYDESRTLQMFLYPLMGQRQITSVPARYGYTDAVQNAVGAKAMNNPLRKEMGVHLNYSASTLRQYLARDIDALTVLRWHMRNSARCSRIDLAIDVRDSDLSIAVLYELLDSGQAYSRALSFTLISGHDGGKTLYVGSRSSETMLRIYDKGKEQGTDENWIRIELEAKGNQAQAIARQLADKTEAQAAQYTKQVIAGLVSFPTPAWSEVIQQHATYLAPANKRETDTEAWLLKVAAPSLGRLLGRSNNQRIYGEFLRTVRMHRYMHREDS